MQALIRHSNVGMDKWRMARLFRRWHSSKAKVLRHERRTAMPALPCAEDGNGHGRAGRAGSNLKWEGTGSHLVPGQRDVPAAEFTQGFVRLPHEASNHDDLVHC